MATKRAIELGQRVIAAKTGLMRAMNPLGGAFGPAWSWVQTLERAAIAVGEERERGRQAKRKGPRR